MGGLIFDYSDIGNNSLAKSYFNGDVRLMSYDWGAISRCVISKNIIGLGVICSGLGYKRVYRQTSAIVSSDFFRQVSIPFFYERQFGNRKIRFEGGAGISVSKFTFFQDWYIYPFPGGDTYYNYILGSELSWMMGFAVQAGASYQLTKELHAMVQVDYNHCLLGTKLIYTGRNYYPEYFSINAGMFFDFDLKNK